MCIYIYINNIKDIFIGTSVYLSNYMWGISLELFHARGIWAMWASCRRAPTTRFLDEGTTPTTTSTKFRATRCYRSWATRRRRDAWQTDAETVELLVWHVHLVYTHHCMTYDISYHIISYPSINQSIYLSIYQSIHLSAHIHTVNVIAGRLFFDDCCYVCIPLFLFGDIYCPFLIILWGYSTIGILLYTTQCYGIMRLIKILHNHW